MNNQNDNEYDIKAIDSIPVQNPILIPKSNPFLMPANTSGNNFAPANVSVPTQIINNAATTPNAKVKRTRKPRVSKTPKIINEFPVFNKSDVEYCENKLFINVLTSLVVDDMFPKKTWSGKEVKSKLKLYKIDKNIISSGFSSNLTELQTKVEKIMSDKNRPMPDGTNQRWGRKDYFYVPDQYSSNFDYYEKYNWKRHAYFDGIAIPKEEDIKYLILKRKPTRNDIVGVGFWYKYINIPFVGGIVFGSYGADRGVLDYCGSDIMYANLIKRIIEGYVIQTHIQKDKITVELIPTITGVNPSYIEVYGGMDKLPFAVAKAYLLSVAKT